MGGRSLLWFLSAHKILDTDEETKQKAKELYASIDSKRVVLIFFNTFTNTLKNFMKSNLPFSMKVALPVTAIATMFLGTQGAGIVAFGGGIGLPVVVLLFLGSAGIASILEPFVSNDLDEKTKYMFVSAISTLGVLTLKRKLEKEFEKQLKEQACAPKKQKLTGEELKMKEELQSMEPLDFERHVMSYFEDVGFKSAVTLTRPHEHDQVNVSFLTQFLSHS